MSKGEKPAEENEVSERGFEFVFRIVLLLSGCRFRGSAWTLSSQCLTSKSFLNEQVVVEFGHLPHFVLPTNTWSCSRISCRLGIIFSYIVCAYVLCVAGPSPSR